MRLTDISLDWLLPGGVLLVGILAAVAVLARGKRASVKAAVSSEDSWERQEERRRRKEAIYGTASYALLFCCAAVAAALSFHGLVGFGQENLNLTDGWEYLVPFGLDGAAMFCSVLAVREASHGDAALGSRLLVWLFAGAAAWFNWVHAPRGFGRSRRAPVLRGDVSLVSGAVRPCAEADPQGRAARTGPGAAPVAADPDRTVAACAPRDLRRLVADAARRRPYAGRGGRRSPRGQASAGADQAPQARTGEAGPGADKGAQPAAPLLAAWSRWPSGPRTDRIRFGSRSRRLIGACAIGARTPPPAGTGSAALVAVPSGGQRR